jgi:Sec-independent protein secretion pathway component TatC
MHLILIVLYLLTCVVCGLLGRQTAFGFIGHFVLAIVITPIGDFIVQMVARPAKKIREKLDEIDDY